MAAEREADLAMTPSGATSNSVLAASVGAIAIQTYSGAAIEPTPAVALGGATLTEGKDYDVTYANNVNAGTATMTITGKGAYTGTKDVTFTIFKADVSKVTFTYYSPLYFTGSALTPEIVATFGETTPMAGTDFKLISCENNVKVGWATATIEGMGTNFTGTTTMRFYIVPADISTATVAAIPDQTWTGSALTPAPAVTWNGLALEEGVDYTLSYAGNVEVGTATVTITGRGNFDGGSSASATFRVAPVDIARASVAAIAARTFTGSAITPATTVTLGGRTLVAGTDYAVDYGSTNVGAGTASGTVTGLGHYGGTCSTRVTFAISPASISSATCDPIPDQTYSGFALMPRPAITWNGLTLAGGTDYTLRYENNVNAGTATLTIDGTHNFTGSLKLSFTIDKADISLATFSFDPIAYTGSAVEPVITGSYNDLQLTSGDFTVAYSNNVSAGHGTATVTGMGNNFTGTSSVAFTIDPADISSAAIADIGNQPFTGKACDPPLVITYKGVALVRDTDFTVSYNGTNTSAGTATATIFGRGNYSGTTTKRFNILFSTRLAGQGALDTMAVIVDEAFPSTSDTVVIARDDGYHDALTASGIAGLAKAPVLLVKTNSLPDQTRKEIARLQPKTIIVCGGTSAVSDATAQAAAAVTGASYYRCYGSGAAETASNIFEQGPAITGKNWGKVAFVATNQSYQDALSISPYAYAKGCPIFLASSKTTISDSIVKTIASGGFDQVYVVGGSGVVDPAIVTKLASAGVKVSEANRIWGKGALETSEAIAEWEYDRGMSADNLAIADRDGYWDALSGAALCGSKNTVLLLVEKSNVNKVALNGFASTHKSEIGRAYVLGGALAVPETTRNYLEAILSP